jgi:hypothetical protein
MSRLSEIHERMQADWSRLQESWQTTRAHWRDEVAASFERRQWQEWDQDLPLLLNALQELTEVCDQAMRSIR